MRVSAASTLTIPRRAAQRLLRPGRAACAPPSGSECAQLARPIPGDLCRQAARLRLGAVSAAAQRREGLGVGLSVPPLIRGLRERAAIDSRFEGPFRLSLLRLSPTPATRTAADCTAARCRRCRGADGARPAGALRAPSAGIRAAPLAGDGQGQHQGQALRETAAWSGGRHKGATPTLGARGEVAERPNALVLKTRGRKPRGFESHPLRHIPCCSHSISVAFTHCTHCSD